MPQTYLTTLQLEFVIRACASYINDLQEQSLEGGYTTKVREEYESLFSKESVLFENLQPRLAGDLAISKRMEETRTAVSSNKPGETQPYSRKVLDETQRTLEILKRNPLGIECVNTFREGEVCGHDRAHHFKVVGKKNPICRTIGCPCDNFTAKPKEPKFDNGLGLTMDDFDLNRKEE